MLETLRVRYATLQPRQRTMLIAGFFALASLSAAMTWWSGRTDWRPLFNGLEARDVQQVEQQLATAGIAYQPTPDGAGVEVPSEQMDKARMAVAAKGMPGSGRMGFELFDKPNWVGSEFDEKVNYQRALEGELEHTIETLGVVRSARVHLTLPKQSLFAAEEHPATASVVLKMRKSSISREQADSIRSLVAGAVENLHPEQVTLVDTDGRSNLNASSHGAEGLEQEAALEQKLVAMLEPLAGAGNVHATVNLNFEQATEDRTDEVYDPQQSATVSMQRSEQTPTEAAKSTGGVAGTASNTPAGAASQAGTPQTAATPPLLAAGKKEALPVYPQGNGGGQTVREESSNYAVTRHVVHTQRGAGEIRRVVAAVVVNDRASIEKTGKDEHTVWKPRTADEMRRLEQLAQAAIGFDAKRSDQVVVENIAFSGNVAEAKVSPVERLTEQANGILRGQPVLLRSIGTAVGCLLLCLLVLRPLTQQIGKAMTTPLLGAGAKQQELAMGAAEPVDPSVPLHLRGNAFQTVTQHIRNDPQQSARLLESWIASTTEGGN